VSEASREELLAQVPNLHWYHSIDLGDGVVTPGDGAPNTELQERALPDFRGRSVLDIGAWDGLYSFLAERRGASRVVALDHYAWGVDFAARHAYWRECEARGELPDPRRDTTDFYHPDELPGRKAFDLARRILGSKVEPVVADFMQLDPEETGPFDIVLFLGVLYHLREPLSALEKVRSLTGEVAVIESEAVRIAGFEDSGLLEFYAGDEWMSDHTNWFAPTEAALTGMCRAAGFRSVETKLGPPPQAAPDPSLRGRAARTAKAVLQRANLERVHRGRPEHYRIVVHARP
jgi:tRNA (mo5U34)-methyltransferase